MAGRSSIGLDIGTSAVRVAQVSVARGEAKLERIAEVALPPGAVVDGEVVDIPAVAAAISELRSLAKLSSKKVALGVASRRVVVRQVDLPWMPTAELRQSLALHVQDVLPMPVESAFLDIHVLEEIVAADGARFARGLLVAAAREVVDNAVAAVQQAGLVPVTVDLLPLAMLRSLGWSEPAPGQDTPVVALLDIGAQVTNLVIHRGGHPLFVRILLRGGNSVTHALADRLGMDYDRAELLKRGLPELPLDEAGTAVARTVLDTAVVDLLAEVRGSVEYFSASGGAGRVAEIVVSGGGSRLDGLLERLAAETQLPVRAGRPLEGLRVGRTGLGEDTLAALSTTATVPVGLALAGI